MAEGLFRRVVRDRGEYYVISAGVGAVDGLPPSENAVRALRELGIDIAHQRSHPVALSTRVGEDLFVA
jgi:protein-tyrosine-phosphatase